MPEWFRRFGDIPGISYRVPGQFDRRTLIGYDAYPEVQHVYGIEGENEETLWWPPSAGTSGGSASPAHYRAFADLRGMSAAEIVRHVHEGLELPGEPGDYHFLIQGCAEQLWRCRRNEPSLVTEVERLCWLDIGLVQACPDAVTAGYGRERSFYAILGFGYLIEIYEGASRLAEALEVAELAAGYGQCEDARRRLLWRIRAAKAGDDEGASLDNREFWPPKQPSLHPNGARPNLSPLNNKVSDSAFRSAEPDGPFAGSFSHQYEWWDDLCQHSFDQLWTDEGDRVADELADRYWFAWPWLIGRALITAAPATYQRITVFAMNENRSGPAHIPDVPHMVDQIATWGAFQVVRRRRTWREPSAAVCPICGQDFWSGDIQAWACRAYGPPRYCMNCCVRVRIGDPRPTWSQDQVKAALHELSGAFGTIPSQGFANLQVPHDGTSEERDRRLRALIAMPPVVTIKRVLGQKDWLGALHAAGLVGEAWRPSFGTWCRANDGHRCRSLLEKTIDDWFLSNNIVHECEPSWPHHPELNPSGLKRADWLLGDGTFVECAGMLESEKYAHKIAQKRQLARTLDTPLIVVGPTDMHRLGSIFARQLQSGQPST